MRRLGVLVIAVECIVGLAVGVLASPGSASRDQPEASASFTVTVGGQAVRFDYGHSPIVKRAHWPARRLFL